MFAKNPSLKDTTKVLKPSEDQALLEVANSNTKEPQRNLERSKFGSQQAIEVPLMQKYQINTEVDDYKKV